MSTRTQGGDIRLDICWQIIVVLLQNLRHSQAIPQQVIDDTILQVIGGIWPDNVVAPSEAVFFASITHGLSDRARAQVGAGPRTTR